MKLYDGGRAPNPRRVRIFLAEKGVSVPLVQVDFMNLEHKSTAFAEKNPLQRIPVLELDDGTCISETMAICRYFEELHPEPALFGRDAREKAITEMWNRRVELGLFSAVAAVVRHSVPVMAAMEVPQVAAWAEVNRARVPEHLAILDAALGRHAFVAGENYSVADITALAAVDFMRLPRIPIPDSCANIRRWHAEVSARPSANA
ncbi:MAG: glutathione S-transferase family protein [Beijerinckiaceae bacterium]